MIDLRTKAIGTNLGRRPRELSGESAAWIVSKCDVCGEAGLMVQRIGRRRVFAHAMDEIGFTDLHTRASAYYNFGTTKTGKRMRELKESSDWELVTHSTKVEINNALECSIVPSFKAREEIEALLVDKIEWPAFETVERLQHLKTG